MSHRTLPSSHESPSSGAGTRPITMPSLVLDASIGLPAADPMMARGHAASSMTPDRRLQAVFMTTRQAKWMTTATAEEEL